MFKKLLVLLFLVLGLLACGRQEQLPEIALHSPAENTVLYSGDRLNISGRVTSEKTITEVRLRLVNLRTNDLVFEERYYPNQMDFDFGHELQITVGTHTDMVVQVDAIAGGQTATLRRNLHVMP